MKINITEIPTDQQMAYADGYKAGHRIGKHEVELQIGGVEDSGKDNLHWVQAFNHGKRVALGLEDPPTWVLE